MAIKIKNKIVDYRVVNTDSTSDKPVGERQDTSSATASLETMNESSNIVQMHEKVMRPDRLIGNTYKIKTPISEHAFYITINDIILNPGTPFEKHQPFEIFINSKNMDHYQWISGLTLIISAVFRKGGDVAFLVDELQSVFDPKGGYFRRGGKFMPSLVAEIGDVIECHLKMIGMIVDDGLNPHQQAVVDQKRKEFEQQNALHDNHEFSNFPIGAIICTKCNIKATILLDGCMTCLNCGESKCG